VLTLARVTTCSPALSLKREKGITYQATAEEQIFFTLLAAMKTKKTLSLT